MLLERLNPLSQKALTTVYYSYFHSLLKYGIIFWGNSQVNRDIFKIQKKAMRIISGKSCRDPCRLLFKQLNILTLTSQYIVSLLEFVLENRNLLLSIETLMVLLPVIVLIYISQK